MQAAAKALPEPFMRTYAAGNEKNNTDKGRPGAACSPLWKYIRQEVLNDVRRHCNDTKEL